jgi:hypothetical protein
MMWRHRRCFPCQAAAAHAPTASPSRLRFRLDAVVSCEAHEAPAWDEIQSSARGRFTSTSLLLASKSSTVSLGSCSSSVPTLDLSARPDYCNHRRKMA